MENLIVLLIFAIFIIVIILSFRSAKAVLKSKKLYLLWLDQRIVELQKEYDGIVVYDNTPEFQVKLTTGGKLKAYKEIRDYIFKH